MIDHDETQSRELHELWRKAWPPGLPSSAHHPHGERPLSDYLRHWAAVHPAKPAVIFYGAELTFQELDRLSDRFAALLAQEGIARGDRVCVMMPNCPQFHVAFFGILKRGAVYAPLSPMSTEQEARYQLVDSGSAAMVVLDALMPIARAAAAQSPVRRVFVTSFEEVLPDAPTLPIPSMIGTPRIPCPDAIDLLPALRAMADPVAMPSPRLDEIAALNYTGGTTGMPKGCIHTQGDMVYTAASNYHINGLGDHGVALSFWPEFWIAGENNGLIHPLFAGATLVLLSRWDVMAFMQAVDRYRVTFVALPMDSAVEVMEHARVGEFDLRSLKHCRAASFVKKLNVDYRRRWRELTGAVLLSAPFGMTETHTNDSFTLGMEVDDLDLKSVPIFVGLPVPGTEFKICDFETGQRVEVQNEGEICVRSPSVTRGYWNNPTATAQLVRDGWLHTGDIGVIDQAGYLHYLGRRREMIKVKGMSVFPAELEAVIAQHPAVQSCAVVAIPDDERGQLPVAFVIAPAGAASLDAGELTAWCRSVMASYKVPRIEMVDAFPMTGTGKVRKDALVALAKAASSSC